MSTVHVSAAGETVAVDYTLGGAATWEQAYAARDWAGLLAWYRANTGRRSAAPLRDFGGQVTVNQTWLTANAYREGDRWIIENVLCSNFRLTNVNDVTIRQCVMRRRGRTMNYIVHAPVSAPARRIVIEDCTIDAEQFDCFGVYFPAAAYVADDIVVRRCDISGVQSAVHATRGHTVEGCLIHDLYYFTGSHNTAMSFRGGHAKATRNLVVPGQTGSSGVNFYAELGPTYDQLRCVENVIDAPNATVTINFPDGDDSSILYSDLEPGMTRICRGNVLTNRASNPHQWSEFAGNTRFDGTPV